MKRERFQKSTFAIGRMIKSEQALKAENRSLLLAKRSAGLSVLLLHGFSASPYETRDLAFHLQRRHQAAVYAPRLTSLERKEFDSSRYTEWLQRALAAFELAKGLGERMLVIGQSGGGVVASLLAAQKQAGIKAIILATPAFCLADPKAPLSLWAPVRLLIPEVKFGVRHADVPEHWILNYSTRAVAELVRAGRLASREVLKLKLPLLMLQASDDDTVSASFNQKIFPKIASKDKQFFLYDSKEHNVIHRHNEKQKQVFDWIDQFVETYCS